MTTASSGSTAVRTWNEKLSVAEVNPERFAWRAALGWVPVSG